MGSNELQPNLEEQTCSHFVKFFFSSDCLLKILSPKARFLKGLSSRNPALASVNSGQPVATYKSLVKGFHRDPDLEFNFFLNKMKGCPGQIILDSLVLM